MGNREVHIEKYIEQVQDGCCYKGYVLINNEIRLYYDLVFKVPIAVLVKKEELPKDVDELRNLIQITVTRDGANVELTNDEYGFFFSMVVEFAVVFYNSPQTRDSNEEFLGRILRKNEPIAAICAASIGMTRSGLCNFSPELCQMLSASKFGLALI